MSDSKRAIQWDDLWRQKREFEPGTIAEFVSMLDNGEKHGFARWVETRTPPVQIEIMGNAPQELKDFLYQQGALSPETVFTIKAKSDVPVVDRRTRKVFA